MFISLHFIQICIVLQNSELKKCISNTRQQLLNLVEMNMKKEKYISIFWIIVFTVFVYDKIGDNMIITDYLLIAFEVFIILYYLRKLFLLNKHT